jgi:hypothetical protein
LAFAYEGDGQGCGIASDRFLVFTKPISPAPVFLFSGKYKKEVNTKLGLGRTIIIRM